MSELKGILDDVEDVQVSNSYKGDNLVVGVRYGGEGIIACHNKCQISCIGSSGDNLCGNYGGHHEVNINGKTLYIVVCYGKVVCENHDG